MKRWILLCIALLMLQACASTAELESRQLAYDGYGDNPCRWGGVTERADAHCAEIRLGLEGYLMVLNEHAKRRMENADDPSPCQSHVARLQAVLSQRDDLIHRALYSCADGPLDGECHVSLLVSGGEGRRYVLDNGALFGARSAVQGVASLDLYSSLTRGNYQMLEFSRERLTAPGDTGL